MKQLVSFLLICFFTITIKSQTTMHPLLKLGYDYQTNSFGELGAKFLFLKTDDVLYRVGASALMGNVNREFAILPKVEADVLFNFDKNVDIFHAYYFLAGAELTNKYVAPKVGLSLFGIIDLSAGYGFSIDKKGLNGKKLDGINVNFSINIPLVAIK